MRYRNIQNENDYLSLLNSGMFFEFHPKLKGNWHEDKLVILEEELDNLKNSYIAHSLDFQMIQTIKKHLNTINNRYNVELMVTMENNTISIKQKPNTITFRM